MGVKTRKLGNINNQIVEWQSVHVSDGSTALTTVAGRGYFINTTSGTQTVNLPGTPRFGDRVSLKDFARTWDTNKITFGSNKFDGVASQTPEFDTKGQTISLIYMGSAQGWSLINDDTTTGLGAQFVAATGGTVATSGNFKIHTFTGDSNFVVSSAGNSAGSNTVSYLVIAGGGSGGTKRGGGGGAGGLREGLGLNDSYTGTPGRAPTGVPVSTTTYPITVGGGAAAGVAASPVCASATTAASKGSNSVFSTITSAGGGRGKGTGGADGDSNGGSGGGGFLGSPIIPAPDGVPAGSGNTPPVSPSQGNNGGTSQAPYSPGQAGGGGGAGGVGLNSNDPGGLDGRGGPGAVTHITGSPVAYAGGGGGGARPCGPQTATVPGGGGRGANNSSAPWGNNAYGEDGTANLGGGGGGSGDINNANSGAGGKGIVIIRYKFQ